MCVWIDGANGRTGERNERVVANRRRMFLPRDDASIRVTRMKRTSSSSTCAKVARARVCMVRCVVRVYGVVRVAREWRVCGACVVPVDGCDACACVSVNLRFVLLLRLCPCSNTSVQAPSGGARVQAQGSCAGSVSWYTHGAMLRVAWGQRRGCVGRAVER